MEVVTNPEQFACRGDEWGALAPLARDPSIVSRRRVHPDGFVEWTTREDDREYDIGPNPHKKPNPHVARRQRPVGFDAARQRCAQRMRANQRKVVVRV